jgi:hypothetical protein
LLGPLRSLLRRGLTRMVVREGSASRRVLVQEDVPSERFTLIVALMIVFFAGLVGLEVAHMLLMGSWNEVAFNGIMLVVGTIVGAVWGRSQT